MADDHEREARAARRTLPQALQQVQGLETALRHLQEQVQEIGLALSRLSRVRDDLAHIQSVLPHLQERQTEALALADDALRQRRADMEQFRQATAHLSRDVQALEAHTRTLEERLQNQEGRLRALEEATLRATEEVARLEGRLEEVKRHFQQQANVLGQLSEQVHKLTASVEALEGLRESVRQAASHRDQLGQRLTAVESSLSHAVLEVQELSRHVSLATDRAQEALNRMVVLQKEVDEQARQLGRRLDTLLRLLQRQRRRQIEILGQEVKELRSGLDETA